MYFKTYLEMFWLFIFEIDLSGFPKTYFYESKEKFNNVVKDFQKRNKTFYFKSNK